MNAASQIDASLEAQLREILDSMRAKDQPQMRLEATKILGSVTASLPLPAFRKLGLVAALKARFQDHAAIGHAAVVSLINAVAEHPTLVVDVVKENLLSTAMEALQDPSCEIREVLVMLLSNLSADPNFASQLMQEHTELEGLYLTKLISWFLKYPGDKKTDPFGFVANILTNISQLRVGRSYLMHDKRNILKSLLPIVQTDNLIRKLGILKTARNCCYDRHRHDFLVAPALGLIEALVLPLVGPESVPFEDCARMLPGVRARMLPTAARDANVEVRRLCVEIIHLLVVNRPEREYLRGIQVYTTLRELHKVETDEALIASIEEAVQYFLMDEAGDVNGPNAAILAAGNAALAAAEAGNANTAAAANPELAAAAAAAISSKAALATVAEDEDDEVPRLVPSNRPPVVTSANAPPRPDVRRLESLPQGDGVEVDEGDAAAAIAELLDFP